MASGSGDLYASFGPFLTDDFRKVHDSETGSFSILSMGIFHLVPCQEVVAEFLASQYPQDIVEIVDSIDVNTFIFNCFHGGFPRKDAALEAVSAGQFSNGQRSRNLPDCTVKAELAHDHELVQQGEIALARSRYDSQGNGNIIPAAFLMHVRRSKIYDDLSARNPESHGLQ